MGTLITGEIPRKGCFRIEVTLEESLKTSRKEEGLINRTLECENADIEGNFKGTLLLKAHLA